MKIRYPPFWNGGFTAQKRTPMSINDYFENLKEKEPVHVDVQTFKRTLVQSVAVYMYKARVIKTPMLKYFREDQAYADAAGERIRVAAGVGVCIRDRYLEE